MKTKKTSLAIAIREARKKTGLTQVKFAEKLEVSNVTVSKWERGIQVPRSNELEKMGLFDVPPELLQMAINDDVNIEEARKMGDIVSVPLLEWPLSASCGNGNGMKYVDISQSESKEPVSASVLSAIDNTRKPFAIRIDGDSMNGAGLVEGCIAIVNPAAEVRNGNIGLVFYNDSWLIKWVFYAPDGSVELRPANPNYQPIKVEAEYARDPDWFYVIGKVVDARMQMRLRNAF